MRQYFCAKNYKAEILPEKAARSTFVWKICVLNVDEIDKRKAKKIILSPFELIFKTQNYNEIPFVMYLLKKQIKVF